MGLYDTFIVPDFPCPECGHKYNADLQTKDFDSSMDIYHLGEDVRTPAPIGFGEKERTYRRGLCETGTENAIFELHDICPKCDKFFSVEGVIKDWMFIGVNGVHGNWTLEVVSNDKKE